jgi:MraZ protein
MSYFLGQELFTIDNKNRVSIPAKMRKYISQEADNTFTITRGTKDPCILAYPNDEWKIFVENNLLKLNHFDPEELKAINLVNMWCDEVKLDNQQRIVLPKKLLDFAKIDSKVRIIGMVNYIAIWNPEIHDKYMGSDEEEYARTLQKYFGKKSIEF